MKVVFLHIPKTAGQSVRAGLRRAFGEDQLDPVRTYHQAKGASCFANWDRYTVFTGHLNWDDLDEYTGDRFAFSILREPRERIGSFYFYLRAKAERLAADELDGPENRRHKRILSLEPGEYFFGDDAVGRDVRLSYDNFFTSYFGQRTFRPDAAFFKLRREERLNHALEGMASLDLICTVERLHDLEYALKRTTGTQVNVKARRKNSGPLHKGASRWEALDTEVGSSKVMKRLEQFCDTDDVLFEKVASQPEIHQDRFAEFTERLKHWVSFRRPG